jgi:hypothetical protein
VSAQKFYQLVALLIVIFNPLTCPAQTANDLIRLVATDLVANDLKTLDATTRVWAESKGVEQVSGLKRLGAIENVIGATDEVVDNTWLATGRAIHENGASDWRLVFSADVQKVVRIDLTITFIPDQLPTLPTVTFRGDSTTPLATPESLKPCLSYPTLCASQEHGEIDPRVVEFLFATTRQQVREPDHISFSGDRGRDMVLGAARVRVPEDHRIGKIEFAI